MATDEQTISIAVVDHDKIFFDQILDCLRKEKDIRICLSSLRENFSKESSIDEVAIEEFLRLQPRVLLISQTVFREAVAMNLNYLQKIQDRLTDMRVIVLLDHYDEEIALIGIREGIRGYYLRELGPSKIISCVQTVASGGVWLEASLVSRIVEEFSRLYKHIDSLQPPTKVQEERLLLLSPRETEILSLISKSYTNDNIAKTLFISEKTVKTHIRNIFEKTGIRNRAEAMLLVVRSGLTS